MIQQPQQNHVIGGTLLSHHTTVTHRIAEIIANNGSMSGCTNLELPGLEQHTGYLCYPSLHDQPFPKIHFEAGSLHMLAVYVVERFRLSHGEDVSPPPCSSFPQVGYALVDVRLRVFPHGG